MNSGIKIQDVVGDEFKNGQVPQWNGRAFVPMTPTDLSGDFVTETELAVALAAVPTLSDYSDVGAVISANGNGDYTSVKAAWDAGAFTTKKTALIFGNVSEPVWDYQWPTPGITGLRIVGMGHRPTLRFDKTTAGWLGSNSQDLTFHNLNIEIRGNTYIDFGGSTSFYNCSVSTGSTGSGIFSIYGQIYMQDCFLHLVNTQTETGGLTLRNCYGTALRTTYGTTMPYVDAQGCGISGIYFEVGTYDQVYRIADCRLAGEIVRRYSANAYGFEMSNTLLEGSLVITLGRPDDVFRINNCTIRNSSGIALSVDNSSYSLAAGSEFCNCLFDGSTVGVVFSNAYADAPFFNCAFKGGTTNLTAAAGTANGTNVSF